MPRIEIFTAPRNAPRRSAHAQALALVVVLAVPSAVAAAPESARGAAPGPEQVAACDSLVALRQLAAGAHEDRARAMEAAGRQAGCRLVSRAEIGAVERRAMFGGAPYECLSVASGGCLWVLP